MFAPVHTVSYGSYGGRCRHPDVKPIDSNSIQKVFNSLVPNIPHSRFRYGRLLYFSISIATAVQLSAQISPNPPVKLDDGVLFHVGDSVLKLEVCAADIIRVAYAKEPAFFARKTLAAGVRHDAHTQWSLKTENGEAILATDKLQAHVNLASGAVSFFDTAGHLILAEDKAGRTMEPAIVQGDSTFHVRQQWQANAGEALFGLGEQQLGLMNLKGYDLDLWQHNGTVDIPFLVSSRGYGILWDNTSYTRFGDLASRNRFQPRNCSMPAATPVGSPVPIMPERILSIGSPTAWMPELTSRCRATRSSQTCLSIPPCRRTAM